MSETYRHLAVVRTAIGRKRSAIAKHFKWIEKHDKDLIRLVAEKGKLTAKWQTERRKGTAAIARAV
jgi:hypothetical protein